VKDIGKMVAFLADDDTAGFITGSRMLVDGGLTTVGKVLVDPSHKLSPFFNYP